MVANYALKARYLVSTSTTWASFIILVSIVSVIAVASIFLVVIILLVVVGGFELVEEIFILKFDRVSWNPRVILSVGMV